MDDTTTLTTPEGEDTGTVPAEQTQAEDTPTTDQPAAQPETAPPAERTYTTGEMQQISTSQYKAGIIAAMKAIGCRAVQGGDIKAQLQAVKAHAETKLVPVPAEADDASVTLQLDLDAARAENAQLQNKLVALGKGVPAERVEQYIHLAGAYVGEGVGFDAAIDKALEDFPLPVEGGGIPRIVTGATGGGRTPPKDWRKMSLAERAALYRKDPEQARALAEAAGDRLEA